MDELPAPLQPLGQYRQFVTYRLVPSARPGKMDKLPCDWRTGGIANAQAPATWGTFENCRDAVRAGHGAGIGFVFTATDPFWFLDIDGALQPDNTWSQLATDLCTRFAGASVEVSQSGTGLHIIGSGDIPPHACKDTALGLELYHERRFVALTGTQASGDAATDHSAALARLVEETFRPNSQCMIAPDQWTDEPVDGAEPPLSDDELIRCASESGDRSAEAAFGKSATFRDLWEGNDDALATRWPSQKGDAYDRSSADAALATHLAFWTGKDCERIRRLMLQSALVRDKWGRDDYLPRTILNACTVSNDVVKGHGATRVGTTLPTSSTSRPIQATPYAWPDPTTLPTRQWLMGHWFLRGEVTTVIAPGGSGKSTILHTVALSLASGKPLLGKSLPRGPVGVWVFNLEDGTDELQRQLAAACEYHSISPEMCGGRVFLDSGLCQPLRTAIENRDSFELLEPVFQHVAATILTNEIGVLIVDPFVSSHGVHESSNEAIDAIAKRWKRLAQETGCAVVLVHHTRKLGGREATAEDGRGAVALRDAARVVLTLNPMSATEAENLGIANPQLRRSLVRIDVGKANRAPPDEATWVHLSSQSLANGNEFEPPDLVGVATRWEKPNLLSGVSEEHLSRVQERLQVEDWRDSMQAKDWVGILIAEVVGLSPETDLAQIKAIYKNWKKDGWLTITRRADRNGDERPFVAPGKMAVEVNGQSSPHLPTCGAEGAESAARNPS
ncbi:MAG: AAA family ATPase [Sphingomonadaceae bacterium]|nr:AAA family ATPase [Sphingomonadaceae bacterium]